MSASQQSRSEMVRPVPLSFTPIEIKAIMQIVETCMEMVKDTGRIDDEQTTVLAGMQAVVERMATLSAQYGARDTTPVSCTLPLGEVLSLEYAVRTYEQLLEEQGYIGVVPHIVELLDILFQRVRLAIMRHYPAFGVQLIAMDRQQRH